MSEDRRFDDPKLAATPSFGKLSEPDRLSALRDHRIDELFNEAGRAEGRQNGFELTITQLHDDIKGIRDDIRSLGKDVQAELRSLPCRRPDGPACLFVKKPPSVETKPKTSSTYPAVTARDLENSQKFVLAEIEGKIDRSVEERLLANEQRLLVVEAAQERRNQSRRAAVKDWLRIVQIAVGMLVGVGGGATLAWRCAATVPTQPVPMRVWGSTAKPDMAMPFKTAK